MRRLILFVAPWALATLLGMAPPAIAEAPAAPADLPSLARIATRAREATVTIRRAPRASSGEWDGGVLDTPPPDESAVGPWAGQAFDELRRRTVAAGVVVDPSGIVLTSARGILRAPEFEVILSDGSARRALVVGLDSESDVAVLRLEPGRGTVPHLPLGDSTRLRIGDWIIALGAPYGLAGTVSAGIVTATPRPSSPAPLADLLQTDAVRDAGFTGGPVVSLDGEIVGQTTRFTADGVAYVLPSRALRRIYAELVVRGRVSRPSLGIVTQSLSPALATALRAPDTEAVLVADVEPEGPAAHAGLRAGDIVLAVDGERVRSRRQLDRAVAATFPGRPVRLSLRRDGREAVVTVVPVEAPDDWRPSPAVERTRRLIGVEVRQITAHVGVVTVDVEPESAGAAAGIEEGDLFREVNRRPVRSMRDFEAALRDVAEDAPILLLVQRGDLVLYVVVVPGPR